MADKTTELETERDAAQQRINDQFDAEQERLRDEYTGGTGEETEEGKARKEADRAGGQAIIQAAQAAERAGYSLDAIKEAAKHTLAVDNRADEFSAQLVKAQTKADRELMEKYCDGGDLDGTVDRDEWIKAVLRQGGSLPAGVKRPK